MTATGRAVRVRGLRKIYRPDRYREVAALNGVDLDIGAGEIIALLGPNGAGKTTAVQILTGYRRRDAGEVSVLGTDPAAAARGWRARIGIVPQQASDFAELTVREVIQHLAGYYPAPREAGELIGAVGLAGQAGTRLRRLSGGQRRRVDLALGLVGCPELLVLDEPTTGLDPEARRRFWGLIRQLAAGGTTILLSTHYLDEAEALAGRVAVLAAGRIVASGPPAALAGRDTAAATVSWQEDGVARSERTPAPARLVAALAARVAGPDGEVPGLTVTRPSLEDTYLRLIGTAPDGLDTPEGTP
ncbi:MAG: type transport system ATP-binding protein [Streptosporangiaceae bacterium]|nr:type transport system ATP-binding protein [Streptosporangiaceae bacterium]